VLVAPNESFITDADSPAGLAISGSRIQCSHYGAPHGGRGTTIVTADPSGSGANQRLITGARSPAGVTVG
jgi:hypothetical protein